MHMAIKTRPWTRDELARLPEDGQRYEVLRGELLVTPQASMAHQYVATMLGVHLAPYVRLHRLGIVAGPGAVVFEQNELQPDVMVVPVAVSQVTMKWAAAPRALLVVEVLSYSTARRDMGIKREAYALLGIPEYWVLDVTGGELIVFRDPRPAVAAPRGFEYGTVRTLTAADTVAPLAAPSAAIRVADLLP